ncbi:hypothetical protein CEXT_68441 [Caerostris extrusa]|uniref:Uncharacterized protein n=1 Tax=Caerostris extrusa TaxID=172846 RepID=A0AAV4MPN6_CAEEX|nr:hypothetical protein CEXT_68441 [Caerostris extrusa]
MAITLMKRKDVDTDHSRHRHSRIVAVHLSEFSKKHHQRKDPSNQLLRKIIHDKNKSNEEKNAEVVVTVSTAKRCRHFVELSPRTEPIGTVRLPCIRLTARVTQAFMRGVFLSKPDVYSRQSRFRNWLRTFFQNRNEFGKVFLVKRGKSSFYGGLKGFWKIRHMRRLLRTSVITGDKNQFDKRQEINFKSNFIYFPTFKLFNPDFLSDVKIFLSA